MKKGLFLFMVIVAFSFPVATDAAELVEINLGWQVPWALQGQLVQILKHTDIAAKNGLKINFFGRSYGPLLNEAALGGSINILLTGDQPGLQLLIKKPDDWRIIKRLMYNRTVTFVPKNSPIRTMADLKGKTIGLPFMAAVERNTKAELEKSGVDPKKDVKIINVGIEEQGAMIVRNPDAAKWGNFDALAAFDLLPANFQMQGAIRVLEVSKVVSVIIANKKLLDKHPELATKIGNAFRDAYDYYRQNTKQADLWFIKEARLPESSLEACRLAASLEPNLKANSKNEIRMDLNADDLKILQTAADFLSPKKKVNIKAFIQGEL